MAVAAVSGSVWRGKWEEEGRGRGRGGVSGQCTTLWESSFQNCSTPAGSEIWLHCSI